MTVCDHSFVLDFKTIPEMLEHTLACWPTREAYRSFDYAENAWVSITWQQYADQVRRWRRAFHAMGLKPGERVSMLLTNCVDALTFDMAALCNGLVPVPLHAIDTAGSSAYILKDSNARFLVTTTKARWNAIFATGEDLCDLEQVVFTNDVETGKSGHIQYGGVEDWLAQGNDIRDEDLPKGPCENDLSGLVYTSGTTGRPKGVMLTHKAIVTNVQQISTILDLQEDDIYLSFLPLSHTFERTVAYYTAVAHGAAIAFARSVAHLGDDFQCVRPTIMCSVPRVYERFYTKIQNDLLNASQEERYLTRWAQEVGWRRFARQNDLPVEETPRSHLDEKVADMLDKTVGVKIRDIFGGRMRCCLAGGASLNYAVSKFFCAMGLPLRQVYGLTETSPVISLTRKEGNHPASVGHPVPNIDVRIGDNDELQVRGGNVMLGYWHKPLESAAAFTEDGWFKTGDQADLSDGGRIRIKGRIKEIIVTSTGEKISPVDLEFAIQADHLFEQVLVVGENRPFITALVVVNNERWTTLCKEMQLDPESPATLTNREMTRLLVKRVRLAAKDFPQYGVPRALAILREPWSVENGLLTTTMKLKRREIISRYSHAVDQLYAGHP